MVSIRNYNNPSADLQNYSELPKFVYKILSYPMRRYVFLYVSFLEIEYDWK